MSRHFLQYYVLEAVLNNDRTRGILFIIGAAFCFALMNLFVRMSAEVPVFEQCFFRNIVGLLIAAVMVLRGKSSFVCPKGARLGVLLRSVFGTIGIAANYYAIDHMDISDASMLNKLSPFFATIFSIWVLGEAAKLKDWVILMVAFSGALLVIKPGGGMASLPAFIGFIGGAAAGLAYTYVRSISGQVPKWLIIFYFSAFSCLVFLPFMIATYKPLTPAQLLSLVGVGVSASGGQICITSAYTYAPARDISVFDYSQVIFAALLGFVFLGQIPDSLSIAGYVIIIGAAVWKWYSGIKG